MKKQQQRYPGIPDTLVAYLLQELSEDERTKVEQAHLVSDSKSPDLDIAEEDLIDYFVNGEMSKQDIKRMELIKFFESKERQEKLRFTFALYVGYPKLLKKFQ